MATTGRPTNVPPDVLTAILMARGDGFSYDRIAGALDAECVPTSQGGVRWWPATVRAIVLAEGRRGETRVVQQDIRRFLPYTTV
jgi:hypothetical protein